MRAVISGLIVSLLICGVLGVHPALAGENISGIHVVKRGDTLSEIAMTYDVSVRQLAEWNELESNTIFPGQRLAVQAPAAATTYVVQKGDSLWEIAREFDVGVALLRQLNQLGDDRIYPGQQLQLRPSSLDEAVHIVQSGETLSAIAVRYGISLSDLKKINGRKGDRILVGEKLRVKETPAATYIVERGDALWEIARAYDISVERLMDLNGLSSHRIYPGQELMLGQVSSGTYDTYTVKTGDYLGRIARLHQMSVADLKAVNNLTSSVIHPGETLKVNPLLGDAGSGGITLNSLTADSIRRHIIQAENGPYYYTRPDAARQEDNTYFENSSLTPLESYRQARKLWEAFEKTVEEMAPLSDTLKGWYFVLDPGHGGLDPGGVAKSLDGNGNSVFVVEDEYAYDITLRVYVLLRRHGAKATLTVLSPNHLIRQSTPPTSTFVNEKNEVYNSYALNRRNNKACWPHGGSNGNLSNRVQIAKAFFKNVPKNRSIFLSFHADIQPKAAEAPLVLYYQNKNGGNVDTASKRFASELLAKLGAGAYARGQSLGVLRNNPAGLKLLLELRNMAYADHVWALRFEQLRQRDAEKVVKGLLDHAK